MPRARSSSVQSCPQHDYSADVQGFDENAGAIQRAVRLRRNGDFVAMKRRHEDVADQGE